MSNTVFCVVCVLDCLFRECSKSYIDEVMRSFKEYCTSYNWEHSKGESVSEFLGIGIKTFDDGGFQSYQTGLIRKVLGSTGMDHFNGFTIPTKVGHLLGQTRMVLRLKDIGPTHTLLT